MLNATHHLRVSIELNHQSHRVAEMGPLPSPDRPIIRRAPIQLTNLGRSGKSRSANQIFFTLHIDLCNFRGRLTEISAPLQAIMRI